MRAALLGLAGLAIAGLGPAAAAPFAPGPVAVPATDVEQARVVSRTVTRGPRCKTVVTKRRGPGGRVVVVRKRRCL